MALSDRLRVIRVTGDSERTLAIEVMRATYKQEKNWITRDEKLFPDDELGKNRFSWFVVLDVYRSLPESLLIGGILAVPVGIFVAGFAVGRRARRSKH